MAWWSAQAHTIEEWEQISTRAFVDLRCRPLTPRFRGSLRQASLSTVSLNWITTDPLRVERTQESARRYGGDALLLALQTGGHSTVEQAGRTARVAPGNGVLYDPRHPYVLDFPAAAQHLVVVGIDRRDLPYADTDIDRLVARTIDPHTAGLSSLSGLLTGIGADSADTAALAERLLPQLVTLIADHVLDADARSGRARQHLSAVQDWIRHHLDAPDLSAAMIAAEFFMSERSLYTLFEIAGYTPAAWIRRQRASRAEMLLTSTDDPIATVAVACGYADQATFGRFFKNMTGATPAAYRRRRADGAFDPPERDAKAR